MIYSMYVFFWGVCILCVIWLHHWLICVLGTFLVSYLHISHRKKEDWESIQQL